MALPKNAPPLKTEKSESQKSRTRWLRELELAHQHEKDWRERGKKIVERYRDDRKSTDGEESNFNILYANTEILKNSTYAKPPIPIVRRRWDSGNPIGIIAARILERAISYNNEHVDIDETLKASVEDMFLPGRGVARVKYVPEIIEDSQRVEVTEEMDDLNLPPEVQKDEKGYYRNEAYDRVVSEEVKVDYVDWRWFRYSPATSWKKVHWVAYGELLTKDECIKQFGKTVGKKIKLSWKPEIDGSEGDRETMQSRALIWTIWNKPDEKVYVLSEGYEDGLLSEQADPLKLEGFFPCPEPIYDIKTNGSLIPVPNFIIYQDQADELDELTQRITRLTAALVRRGLYDASMPELEKLASAGDNVFIPVENMAQLKEKGGLEAAFMSENLAGLAQVLLGLYQQRDQCKSIIYEVMGIADIVRGVSKASETLGAQQLKSQYSSLRIKSRQTSVMNFALRIMRMEGEIISEHFSPETLAAMTGVKLPTAEEKMRLQQEAMMAQMQGQQVPPNPMAQLPSWEEVMALLRNDKMRGFSLEIETDSTIALNEADEQESAVKMMAAFGQIGSQIAPAVKEGFLPPEAAKAIVKFAARKFHASREIEDSIEQASLQPKQDEQDPAAMAEVQIKQQQMQADQQESMQKLQLEQQRMQMDQQNNAATLQLKQQEITANLQLEQAKMQQASEIASIELQAKQQDAATALQLDVAKMAQEKEIAIAKAHIESQTKIDIERMKLEAQTNGDIERVQTMMTEATQKQSGDEVMSVLQQLLQKLTLPKKVLRDSSGRVDGVKTVQ